MLGAALVNGVGSRRRCSRSVCRTRSECYIRWCGWMWRVFSLLASLTRAGAFRFWRRRGRLVAPDAAPASSHTLGAQELAALDTATPNTRSYSQGCARVAQARFASINMISQTIDYISAACRIQGHPTDPPTETSRKKTLAGGFYSRLPGHATMIRHDGNIYHPSITAASITAAFRSAVSGCQQQSALFLFVSGSLTLGLLALSKEAHQPASLSMASILALRLLCWPVSSHPTSHSSRTIRRFTASPPCVSPSSFFSARSHLEGRSVPRAVSNQSLSMASILVLSVPACTPIASISVSSRASRCFTASPLCVSPNRTRSARSHREGRSIPSTGSETWSPSLSFPGASGWGPPAAMRMWDD
eukprot:3908293-Rhodomonas_salina.2